MKSRKQQPPLWRGAGHLPRDDGQAKEGKGASLPYLELLVSFPGTGSDELQGHRGAQGWAAEAGKSQQGFGPGTRGDSSELQQDLQSH